MIVIVLGSIPAAQEIDRIDARTPRDVQIRIAMQAAPHEVSEHADIYALGEHGYELARQGDNGFSCLIEREKVSTMEPECYDAEGSKTTLKVRFFVEQERSNHVSDEEIQRAIKSGYESGRFKPPSRAGIVYMMSDSNYVLNPETGKIIHFPGHLMFYAPYATEKTVGSGDGAPYIVHPGEPDALMIVVPASSHSHN